MKKALALVLALVLALSMAVSAFALMDDLVTLVPVPSEGNSKTVIKVVDAAEPGWVLYATQEGTYYIALNPELYYVDVKLTTNGILDAERIEWDPETMVLDPESNMVITYTVYDVDGNVAVDEKEGIYGAGLDYEVAKEVLEYFENRDEVTTYTMECDQCVNIIKVTCEENYTAHYLEGTLKIDATWITALGPVPVTGTLTFINDVAIFEYEEVKHASKYYADNWAIEVGEKGYSDYATYLAGGYGWEYDPDNLRYLENAAVVSTTAFRAIAGQNLCVVAASNDIVDVFVDLTDIAEGQKGVNFKNYTKIVRKHKTDTPENAAKYNPIEKIEFGFYGDQVIKGDWKITCHVKMDYYDIREYFGLKVEEDDIITYYVVDENNNVVDELTVDYMTDDLTKTVSFEIEGNNSKLGTYAIVLEVPAVESGAEENPNTGAESVVGVVAALAVVSVATAAAVSLKK